MQLEKDTMRLTQHDDGKVTYSVKVEVPSLVSSRETTYTWVEMCHFKDFEEFCQEASFFASFMAKVAHAT